MKIEKKVMKHKISKDHLCGYVKIYFPKEDIGKTAEVSFKVLDR